MDASKYDRELQEMALTRLSELKHYVDTTKLIVCTERKKGKSLQQISTIVKKSKTQVFRLCGICPKK